MFYCVTSRPLQEILGYGRSLEIFKEGMITSIFKGGSRSQAKKYRPVVLTSHIMKALEIIVRKRLVTFLEYGKLNPGQHGFYKGRPCRSQLLKHYKYLLNSAKDGKSVDVIDLDFARAFDKVYHGILLYTVRDLGIQDIIRVWLHSFLSGRKISQSLSTE